MISQKIIVLKKIFIVFIFLIALAPLSCGSKQPFKALITSVHDGDTFYTASRTIRLFGVDTPEITNDFKAATDAEEIYGEAARDYTRDMVLNKIVTLENITNDKYSREVDKVFVDNSDLALDLLQNGLARVAYFSLDQKNPFYNSDFAYYEKLLNAQLAAYQAKVGIWKSNLSFKEIFPKA